MLLLSCKQTCGVNAVVIYKDGYLVSKSVTRISRDLGLYGSYIEGFKRAFSHLRLYIEKNGNEDVVIECNSTVFTNWLRQGEPKRGFEDKFGSMWKELDRIPVRYSMIHSKDVKASKYAKESELTVSKLETLDL
mgnify:CR=1 FL=1